MIAILPPHDSMFVVISRIRPGTMILWDSWHISDRLLQEVRRSRNFAIARKTYSTGNDQRLVPNTARIMYKIVEHAKTALNVVLYHIPSFKIKNRGVELII